MEGILFGFFLGALAGGALAVVVLRFLRERRAADFDRLVVKLTGVLPDDPVEEALARGTSQHNLLSHNNLSWLKKERTRKQALAEALGMDEADLAGSSK